MHFTDIQPTFTRLAIEKIYGSAFTDGNSVQLLWKGKETFQSIFDSIAKAEKLICLEFYIFRNDETGIELAELLKKKAKEGVSVYLLYDHFGSFGTPSSFWSELKKAGVRLRASNPFKWLSPMRYVHRDHRKLVIIDGQKAFTGGLNIANEYRGFHLRLKKEGWRDTGIMLEGPIALTLLRTFKKSWEAWEGEPIPFTEETLLSSFPGFRQGVPVIPIFAASGKGRRRMRRLLYYSINRARHSIFLTTAYFTPSWRMLGTLEDAAKRGVRVRLLLPGKSDVLAAHYAGRAFFTRLLRAGIEIYNYQREILHAKTYVFDECWSIIGSANLDFQSLRWNDEGNVGILDCNFGQQMIDIFNDDLKHSIRIEEDDWLKRPLCEKVKERFFVLFRRRL